MVRHFYYIILLTMMLNIILNIPMVLIQNRFNGSLMSMLISIFVGGIFVFFFTKAMSRFPGKGLPEIFRNNIPGYIRNPYLAFLSFMWMASGAFALISYSYVVKFYLSPDSDLKVIVGFFIIIVILGASKRTDSILFLSEMIILAATPLVAFILFKALSSKYFNLEHIYRMLHYFWQPPDYSSISAATYIFIGYINLVIINRYIDSKKVLKFIWTLPIIGFCLLCSTFFIPIGFLGIWGVNDVVFPWIFITDSLRMEFGFIERVLYLILCLFLLLTLLFGIITWHIGLKLLEGIFSSKSKIFSAMREKRRFFPIIFLIGMGIMTVFLESITNQREFFFVVRLWLNIRLPAELMLVVLVFFLSWRQKHEK